MACHFDALGGRIHLRNHHHNETFPGEGGEKEEAPRPQPLLTPSMAFFDLIVPASPLKKRPGLSHIFSPLKKGSPLKIESKPIRDDSTEALREKLESLHIDRSFHSKLLPIISDPEVQTLYSQLFGEFPLSFEQLKCAIEEGASVDQIDLEIREKLDLPMLVKEWEALPDVVKWLFGDIDSSAILNDLESFKLVLHAIRTHNLLCVGDRLSTEDDDEYNPTREECIRRGELVAEELLRKADTITELDLRCVGITRLPLEVTKLTHLEKLSVCGNALSTIPPQIGNLTELRVLNLAHNYLSTLPREIWNLYSLKFLDLSDNLLTSLPSEIRNLSELVYLSLSQNRLTSIPPDVGDLFFLTFLDLSQNRLTSLPSQIGSLFLLTFLDLSKNSLTSLPPDIRYLTHLEELFLAHNQLVTLPSGIRNFLSLSTLTVANNCLAELPPEIEYLESLRHLDLSNNLFTKLPPEIWKLGSLIHLNLSLNHLKSVDPEMGKLRYLERVDLSVNQLSFLPPEIWGLSKRAQLEVGCNHLTTVPTEIINSANISGTDRQTPLTPQKNAIVWIRR